MALVLPRRRLPDSHDQRDLRLPPRGRGGRPARLRRVSELARLVSTGALEDSEPRALDKRRPRPFLSSLGLAWARLAKLGSDRA